jgi:hypothetical protein
MPSPGGELLRVGIIGLGYWGPNLLRVLADDVDVEIAWICDRDPQRLARYHRRHPNAQATERAELIPPSNWRRRWSRSRAAPAACSCAATRSSTARRSVR